MSRLLACALALIAFACLRGIEALGERFDFDDEDEARWYGEESR